MNIAWLEAPGLLAALTALFLTRRASRRRIADVSLRALLLLLAFNHACNLLEAVGQGWADRIADQVSLVVPLLWGLFLLEMGRQYLSERLRASDEQLRFFLENVPAAVAGLDAQSRLLGYSRTWGAMFGEAALGAPLSFGVEPPLGLPHSLDVKLPGVTAAIAACASGSAEFLSGEETAEHSKARTFRWAVRGWKHPDQRELGVLLLLEDITPQLDAEAERLAAAEELSRTQRLAEVGQLAAGAAHDFNNFLQIINNSLDDLSQQNAAGAEAVHNIAQAVESATAMTRAMLHFGRGREGALQSVDLKGLIEQVRGPLGQALGRRHRLVVSYAEDSTLTVWGNPRRLEQALLNLTMNARDAMPRGGSIELSVSSAGSQAEISVRDYGVGMAEDVRAQLFTPFFTTKGTRGTGLGLRVVKTTMEEHQGSVAVESQPGQGTTFRLLIPLIPRAVAPTPERAQAARSSRA